MSGFVYIWMDTFRKRYYIGSHLGTDDDGYVCSSKTMLMAYAKRPEKFKRRIIQRANTHKELLLAEQQWLNLIQDSDVGKKYYNLKKIASGGNGKANFGKRREKSWNTGLTKQEMETYRRKNKKPLAKQVRQERSFSCKACGTIVVTKSATQTCCSKSCSGKVSQIGRENHHFKKGMSAWNKGKNNPDSRENAIRGAEKLSKKCKGRKRHYFSDGSFTWKYEFSGGWYIKQNGEQVPVL